MSALEKQTGGNHYKKCSIQPIEYIHANNLPFIEGNVVKYITRHKDKNGKQDNNTNSPFSREGSFQALQTKLNQTGHLLRK